MDSTVSTGEAAASFSLRHGIFYACGGQATPPPRTVGHQDQQVEPWKKLLWFLPPQRHLQGNPTFIFAAVEMETRTTCRGPSSAFDDRTISPTSSTNPSTRYLSMLQLYSSRLATVKGV